MNACTLRTQTTRRTEGPSTTKARGNEGWGQRTPCPPTCVQLSGLLARRQAPTFRATPGSRAGTTQIQLPRERRNARVNEISPTPADRPVTHVPLRPSPSLG